MPYSYYQQRIAKWFYFYLARGDQQEDVFARALQRFPKLNDITLQEIMNRTLEAMNGMVAQTRSTPEQRAALRAELEDKLDAYRRLHP